MMIVIFAFSATPAEESTELSDGLSVQIVECVAMLLVISCLRGIHRDSLIFYNFKKNRETFGKKQDADLTVCVLLLYTKTVNT